MRVSVFQTTVFGTGVSIGFLEEKKKKEALGQITGKNYALRSSINRAVLV